MVQCNSTVFFLFFMLEVDLLDVDPLPPRVINAFQLMEA